MAVAFSGGVDSTFLLAVAHDVLGDRVVALTARSAAVPARETDEARRFCAQRGIRQHFFDSRELSLEGFDHNPPDRCYLCKKDLFGRFVSWASSQGIAVVADGSNADDAHVYRPGSRALAELGVASPLQRVGLAKDEIRSLSRELGLPTWSKQSSACLYSRFPYGARLTREGLERVGRAEQFLLDEGFSPVRVRVHGDLARVEVASEDLERACEPATRRRIVEALHGCGYAYVTLDLQGFRSGSMDEVLGGQADSLAGRDEGMGR